MGFLAKEVEAFEIVEEHELEKKALSKNSRGRNWVGTWNNPTMTDDEFLKHFQILEEDEIIKYAVFQREKGEEKGTIHFQFFFSFKTPKSFNQVKNEYLPYGCHFAPMISNVNRCREYCSKVDTRVSGPYEIGELIESGTRSDLAQAVKMIDDGISFRDLCEIFPSQTLMYSRQLKEREQMAKDAIYSKKFRILDVTYIYGTAGSGKTRYVMDKYGYDSVYRVKFYDSRAFDAYKGQDIILFDEFRSSFKIIDMLHYLDGYPLELPCRFSDKIACYTKVYIISNIPLREQYVNIQESEPETYKAFLRRIRNVYRFDEMGLHSLTERGDSGCQLELMPVEDNGLPF